MIVILGCFVDKHDYGNYVCTAVFLEQSYFLFLVHTQDDHN